MRTNMNAGRVALSLLFSTTAFVSALATETPIQTSYGGMGRFRFEQSDRTDYASRRSAFLMRVRPEIRLSKGSEYSLFVQPQFAKAFGRPEFSPSSATANTANVTSGSVFDNSFSLHQAYVEWKPSDSIVFTVGRQLLSYGNEVILSSLEWDNVGRSFDTLKGRYSHTLGSVDLFYSKLFAANVTATAQGPGDSDFYGVYSSNDFGKWFSATDFYAFHRHDLTAGTAKDLLAVGARLQSKVEAIDYRVEATKEFGGQFVDAAAAYQVDVEAGWSFDAPFKSRLGLEVFQAGSHYDQLFPLAHKYLGIADIFGRRNIQGAVLHLSANPTADLSVLFDAHYLLRTSTTAPAYKLNGSTALGTGANTSRDLGIEFDLILNYALAKGLTGTVGVAVLLPGNYLKAELGNFNPTFWYTQLVAQL